jgi:hypothetical protein
MTMLLKKAQKHADAGPFLHAVSAADVPDYYSVIIVSCREKGLAVVACLLVCWTLYDLM